LEVVWGGEYLLPEDPALMGTRFCRGVEVDFFALDDDELDD
jgi:hypothetical protein